MNTPPLGFIEKQNRSQEQHDAHDAAIAMMPRFSLPVPQLAKGESVRLYDLWKHPDVVRDVGFPFTRVWQKTGSCVWAGGTAAVMTSIAGQRAASTSPTKAFLPFTLHNYAMSRHYMGDDGQGEGSMGSTFGKSLTADGVRDWLAGTDGMPAYSHDDDAVGVTSRDEMSWSSYRNSNIGRIEQVSKAHLFGTAAECKSTQDIKAMNLNGYGVSFACNNYIGHASVQGSGADACVVGYWDGRGGHQQSVHGYWEHPNLGPLFWVQNNWPGSTYPRDPAGGPVCGCWVTEAHVEAALRLDAEVYGLSHLNWFPAVPGILDLFI